MRDRKAGGKTSFIPGTGGRILVLSMRRLSTLAAHCIQYEFEDVVTAVTGADRVEADDARALEFSRRTHKLLRAASRSPRLARAWAPDPSTVRLEQDYDLFFPIFNNPHELFALATVPDWRRRSRLAACFINEVWAHEWPTELVELLVHFDHVFLGTRHGAEQMQKLLGRSCSYLPLAADVLRFAPLPHAAPRMIDVCNIGRRSAVTHDALMALARERRFFYYYDTIAASGAGLRQRTFHVDRPAEHRLLLASILQRTRYYIANRSRVNEADVARHEVISSRFYEGAAAGTVMLGEAPRSEDFQNQFGWRDAVIPLAFDSPDVERTLSELNADPQRLERVRRENIRQSALHHDWNHRFRTVLEKLGLPPTEAMLAREERLRSLAEAANEATPTGSWKPTTPAVGQAADLRKTLEK
jgi:hypothetical protein